MARYLRKISKAKWVLDSSVEALLSKGDVPADVLSDVRTLKNELSVWKISDDGSNLNAVVAAFATTLDRIENFDYAIFDSELLAKNGIRLAASPGSTKDPKANEEWHADLVDLTGSALISFAQIIFSSALGRMLKSELKKAIVESILDGRFPVDAMNERVREEIRALIV